MLLVMRYVLLSYGFYTKVVFYSIILLVMNTNSSFLIKIYIHET